MATKKELLDELDWLTDKISTQIWTLNLGTLATTWSLLIAGGSVEKLRIGPLNTTNQRHFILHANGPSAVKLCCPSLLQYGW